MGVFYELEARDDNLAANLATCLPAKAASGWFHGAIPVVCPRSFGGIVETIEAHGIGFVVDSLDDVGDALRDRDGRRATANCLSVRDRFTHEHQATRIRRVLRTDVGGVPGAVKLTASHDPLTVTRFQPGTVTVDARLATFISRGGGFNPEFSARENVFQSTSSSRQAQELGHVVEPADLQLGSIHGRGDVRLAALDCSVVYGRKYLQIAPIWPP